VPRIHLIEEAMLKGLDQLKKHVDKTNHQGHTLLCYLYVLPKVRHIAVQFHQFDIRPSLLTLYCNQVWTQASCFQESFLLPS